MAEYHKFHSVPVTMNPELTAEMEREVARFLKWGYLLIDELRIYAKPGQAVIFDGSLYHRGGANQSNSARRVCLFCYQNSWIKSRETFKGPRMTKLRGEGTAEIKLLLGEVDGW